MKTNKFAILCHHPHNTLLVKSINDHMNWFYLKDLNEMLHRFEADKNDEYRIIILDIAKEIYNDKNTCSILLENRGANKLFKKFEYLMPFDNVKRLNIIDKLKIYIGYHNKNTDAYTINDPELNVYFNKDELPLYKQIGTHILVISIVIYANRNITEKDLVGILFHELRHALDSIADKTLKNKVGNTNELCFQLENNKLNAPFKNIVNRLAQCMYYTQLTEIDAHLETAIIEIKKSGYYKGQILDYLKRFFILPEEAWSLVSTTIYNYSALYKWITLLIEQKYYNELNPATDLIINTIYNKNYSAELMKKFLLELQKQLKLFFNRLAAQISGIPNLIKSKMDM